MCRQWQLGPVWSTMMAERPFQNSVSSSDRDSAALHRTVTDGSEECGEPMMAGHDRASGILCAVLAVILGVIMASCSPRGGQAGGPTGPDWADLRERMVLQQIETRGVKDPAVLAAMRSVPRHRFVPDDYREASYQDSPLPIGESQTISQPYIVALMSELLEVEPGDKVLEIGTGSGYQAAVLAAMGVEVFTVEIRQRSVRAGRGHPRRARLRQRPRALRRRLRRLARRGAFCRHHRHRGARSDPRTPRRSARRRGAHGHPPRRFLPAAHGHQEDRRRGRGTLGDPGAFRAR